MSVLFFKILFATNKFRRSYYSRFCIDNVFALNCCTFDVERARAAADESPISLAAGVTGCIAQHSAEHRAAGILSATLLKAEDVLPLALHRLVMIPGSEDNSTRMSKRSLTLWER